ncbi:DUF736 family protein [Parvularcula sp. IMCC14364]|uniref:DUF736 domain-containing protein n=1 Tax=Parvularcula sp. IMCC14364 TaxID=3067902 RepID=UPI002741770C|nr:DUF736 family protein [Parvularcula sp. IMCC14364]
MAQALGYVKSQETGGFEGTLAMLTLKTRISIVPNQTKATERQPDFRIYAGTGAGEIGGGWKRTGKNSGREYISLTFAHPALGPSKLYANLAPASGQDEEEVLAILWNPQD